MLYIVSNIFMVYYRLELLAPMPDASIHIATTRYSQKKTPRNSSSAIILKSRSRLMFSIVSSFIWYRSHVSSSPSSLGSPVI